MPGKPNFQNCRMGSKNRCVRYDGAEDRDGCAVNQRSGRCARLAAAQRAMGPQTQRGRNIAIGRRLSDEFKRLGGIQVGAGCQMGTKGRCLVTKGDEMLNDCVYSLKANKVKRCVTTKGFLGAMGPRLSRGESLVRARAARSLSANGRRASGVKRRASPAQLAALARGRATAALNREGRRLGNIQYGGRMW
jgi:hypothetical protein